MIRNRRPELRFADSVTAAVTDPLNTIMDRIVAWRNGLLLLAAVLVTASIPLSERLTFDQRIESFFSDDHPDIVILRRSRADFGADEFVIAAWTEPRLFSHDGPEQTPLAELIARRSWQPELTSDAHTRIVELAERLNRIPGVQPDRTQHLAGMLDSAPRSRHVRRAMLQIFTGTLVGEDARTTAIILTLLPEHTAPVPRSETIRRIRDTVRSFEPDSAVAGEPVQIHDMFRLVEEDSRILFLASLGILSAILLLLFSGFRWMLGTIGLVLGVVICTRAVLVLQNAHLSMVGSMLNSLTTVIAVATCMHVIVHYRELRIESEQTATPRDAAAAALCQMAAPVFWTCVTTAVGFLSLLVSRITPVRSFSVMITLATGLILVAGLLIFPAMLASGRTLRPPALAPFESRLTDVLSRICRWVEHHPRKTGFVFMTVTALSLPGLLRLNVETSFIRNFRESSAIVRSLKFIESRLGATGTWEAAFNAPAELNDAYLKDVIELTQKLRTIGQDTGTLRVISLGDVAQIPPRLRGPAWMLRRMQKRFPDLVAGMYNPQAGRMRIVLRSAEQQPAAVRTAQIAAVRDVVRRFSPAGVSTDPSDNTASGLFVLLTEVIQSLLQDQMRSFLCATGGIFLCISIAFRSLRLGLIALLPNIFPIALLLGSLGWADVPVNIGTAMIASVSMGLTVDSTIHYIFAFERTRRTRSIPEALQVAHHSAGRAVVFAHLALIAGFAVLTVSRFVPLAWFGGLMSVSMFWGIFGDLLLLPLLLRWTTPPAPAA